MANRAELLLRAAPCNIDTTLAKYANDSVLEQAVIYAEQHMTAQTASATTKAPSATAVAQQSGGANL